MAAAGPAQVRAEIQEGVGIVTLHAPPANLLSRSLARDLIDVVDRMSSDAVKVIVLTGSGRAFSAGADPDDLRALGSDDEGRRAAAAGQEMMGRLEGSDTLIIAAINGICLGGGLELALACHLRFCSDRARLGFPEITLGLIPGLGGTQRLSRLTGSSRALSLILTGDTITAPEAKAIGLVDEVVPSAELIPVVLRSARRIARKPKEVIAAAIETVMKGGRLSLEEGMAMEARAFGHLCDPARRRDAEGKR